MKRLPSRNCCCAKASGAVFVGVRPQVNPQDVQGIRAVVAVRRGDGAVQFVVHIVERHLDAVVDVLLEIRRSCFLHLSREQEW